MAEVKVSTVSPVWNILVNAIANIDSNSNGSTLKERKIFYITSITREYTTINIKVKKFNPYRW